MRLRACHLLPRQEANSRIQSPDLASASSKAPIPKLRALGALGFYRVLGLPSEVHSHNPKLNPTAYGSARPITANMEIELSLTSEFPSKASQIPQACLMKDPSKTQCSLVPNPKALEPLRSFELSLIGP